MDHADSCTAHVRIATAHALHQGLHDAAPAGRNLGEMVYLPLGQGSFGEARERACASSQGGDEDSGVMDDYAAQQEQRNEQTCSIAHCKQAGHILHGQVRALDD